MADSVIESLWHWLKESPDLRPREKQLTMGEVGYRSPLRSAVPLLSTGASGALAQSTVTAASLIHSSPEPRVLRVSYQLRPEQRQLGASGVCKVVIAEGVDGSETIREYWVPLQGIAIAVPAGNTKVDLLNQPATWGEGAESSRVGAVLSCGVLARRWLAELDTSYPVAVPTGAAGQTLVAPQYATRCRVTVLAGSLAPSSGGSPYATPGQTVDAFISRYGIVQLYAAVTAQVSVLWEVNE